MNPTSIVHFREEQKFDQWWIRVLFALPVVGIVIALIQEEASLGDVLPGVIILAVIIGFFMSLKLVTEVRDDGIYIRFFPFHISFKQFAFNSIRSAQALTYRPIWEYGGWGIRYGRIGVAYSVSGNRGLQLVLHNNKRVLIGSQRASQLEQTVNTFIQKM